MNSVTTNNTRKQGISKFEDRLIRIIYSEAQGEKNEQNTDELDSIKWSNIHVFWSPRKKEIWQEKNFVLKT